MMPTEQFANFATTTLNGDINNAVTSIVVTAATSFPASAQYRITIDNEIMIVTAGAGTTTWTVTRGAESTSAASHTSGAAVAHTLTAGALALTLERAFGLGKAGAIGATETDASDFAFVVPYNCTILRMKATLKTAASGNMIVQLRKAAATVTTAPSYSDVSSVLVTFANTLVLATATGFSTNLGEGDFLGFSCSTGSGTDLFVELVVVPR